MTSSFDPAPLLCSKPFQQLMALERVVSPFEVLGIQSDELVHSRMLGSILAAEGPFGLSSVLMPRIASSLRAAHSGAMPDASLLIKLSAARFRVRLEHPCRMSDEGPSQELGRMDLLLEDDVQKLAMVIENKVWAGDQSQQVDRYREWLASMRQGWTTLVVYLTPDKRDPSSDSYDPKKMDLPPCYRLGWKDVATALSGHETKDTTGTVKAFAQNIRRHIMGETEEKQFVREIMSKPELAAAVLTLVRHMPKFANIQQYIVDRVRELTGMEPYVELYPSRGEAREIMVRLKPWMDAGAPICFNFYEGDRPAVRTMIHVQDWKDCGDTLKALSGIEGSAIHKECPVRKDWTGWRLVLADDEDTDAAWERTTILDRSYTENSAKELLKIFKTQYDKLKPTIDAFLKDPAKFGGKPPVG